MSGNPNLQPVKKRKKHAPDRQQPEWLFPVSADNPALKPHKEATAEEKLSKQKSIDFLTRRSVGAPQKAAPPPQLLNLVATFLAEYNFISTGRLFASERQGRSMVDGWQDDTKRHLEQGLPTLSKIYKEWRKEWDERRLLDMTSDEDDDAATKREKMLKKRGASASAKAKDKKRTSSSTETTSESSDQESDIDMGDITSTKPASSNTASNPAAPPSVSSSESEDEDEPIKVIPADAALTSNKTSVKRKATSPSSSSSSVASSTSEDDAPRPKKTKLSAKSAVSKITSVSSSSVSSTSSSSSESESESESDSAPGSGDQSAARTMSVAAKTPLPQSSSDSASTPKFSSGEKSITKNTTATNPIVVSDTSATLSDQPKKATSSTSSSDSSTSSDDLGKAKVVESDFRLSQGQKLPASSPISQMPTAVRKLNQPFSRIPKDIKVDPRLASNAYVSYDYAEKAHQDLIVTKGKGFTKEKNKKKRGSYKGGYIDVEGKKGIKFDD